MTAESLAERGAVASWLSPELLAVVVRADPALEARSTPLLAERDGQRSKVGARWLQVSPADSGGDPIWLVTVVPRVSDGSRIGRLLMAPDDRPLTTDPIESILCEPAGLGSCCRDNGSTARTRIQAFLASAPSAHQLGLGTTLASSLAAIRRQLREPAPPAPPSDGLAAALETVTALDTHSFWLTGWLRGADVGDVSLTAVSPEGCRSEANPHAIKLLGTRDGRSEPGDVRFHALFELDSPSRHPSGWVLELRSPDGAVVEVDAQAPARSRGGHVRTQLLDALRQGTLNESAWAGLVAPTLARLRAAHHDPRVVEVTDFGHVPAAPEISIVVAVRDVDRIQLLLGELARDPGCADAELCFVAHAPEAADLPVIAAELHNLYELPFRVVELSEAAGRPRALNLGASIARGHRLLLMSGDLVPRAPGWLDAMRAVKAQSAAVGAVVPKLLREDDTIASAGFEHVRVGEPAAWTRRRQFAGLAGVVGGANVARRVQASSDACLLLDAALWHKCGGFAELYLGAGDDDEAADLYLRLAGAGLQTWYAPQAELYLLDRPGTATEPAPELVAFDHWRFDQRWAATLAADDSVSPAAPALGGTAPAPPIEHLEVVVADPLASWVRDANIMLPRVDSEMSPYASTYSFAIEGWVSSRDGSPVTVVASADGRVRARTPANGTRDGLTADFPPSEGCQFQFVLGSLTLPTEFEVTFDAVHADGERARLGHARGRRRPLRSPHRPRFQPVVVTTLGRTGSNWVLALLNQHPEIVVYRPFQYEAVMATYWMNVFHAISDPAGYVQAILPEAGDEEWWLGKGRQSSLPLSKPGADMVRWLGGENIESLAGILQGRLDGFYAELARIQNKARATCFAEKSFPAGLTRTIGELYPDGRELVLVRDFRDRVCSILDYNAKRGLSMWGHDGSTTDEHWFAYLRGEASNLLAHWRERKGRAHLVRYEDLITAPEPTIEAVFAYLGVESGAERARLSVEGATNTTPDGQAYHRTASSFAASVGRWKRDLSPEHRTACATAFDDLLIEFGYEP